MRSADGNGPCAVDSSAIAKSYFDTVKFSNECDLGTIVFSVVTINESLVHI